MIEELNKDVLMKGLSDEQAARSKEEFGTNELARKEQESLWSMFIGAFDDIWIKVLCAALVLKIALAVLGVMIPALGGENDVIEIVSIIHREVRRCRKSITRPTPRSSEAGRLSRYSQARL